MKEVTMSAVKDLRNRLNITQTQLALKIGRGMSTIQRWERVAPPRGKALVQLMNIAVEGGLSDIVKVFQESLSLEFGIQVTTSKGVRPRQHLSACLKLSNSNMKCRSGYVSLTEVHYDAMPASDGQNEEHYIDFCSKRTTGSPSAWIALSREDAKAFKEWVAQLPLGEIVPADFGLEE